MARPGEERLLNLAQRISDGEDFDLEKESSGQGELAGEIKRLQLVQRIVSAHQGRAKQSKPSAAAINTADTVVTLPPEEPEGQATVPAFRWGSLEVFERIGEGGFAEVYRARDANLDRDVALKLRKEGSVGSDERARFLHEARQLARLDHPHVLTVFGADENDGRIGLWTELVRGETLREILERQGAMSPAEAAVIGIDLCGALAAVHAAGLVHRDLKTPNAMREQGGKILLMDFGSASYFSAQPRSAAKLPASGTPLYMAPEQLKGGKPDPTWDIYSLGVVLFELATGQLPVQANSLSDLWNKHESGECRRLRDVRPDIAPGYVQIVERALAKEPAERYASMAEMEDALRSFVGSAHVRREQPPAPRKSMGLWAGIAAMALVAVAVVAWVMTNSGGATGLAVEADLFRVRDGVEERLQSGSRIAPGDKLFLEVEGSQEMHVYVINEDMEGEQFVLFPFSHDPRTNPLAAGEHRIPQTGHWEVTSAGGRDQFLIIAARQALVDLEAALEQYETAREGRQVAGGETEQLRGIGGYLPEEPGEVAGGGLSSLAAQLVQSAGADFPVWTRTLVLENPASD